MKRMTESTLSPPPPDDNDGKDLNDVKVVGKVKPKIQRRRVGTARGRGSDTLESSSKRTFVISANKNQSQISTTPDSSNKRTAVISYNKQQIQILFISTSKTRTKHTMSSTILRKKQITTNNNDSHNDDGSSVD